MDAPILTLPGMKRIRIGNTPASWGVLEFSLEGKTDPYSKVLDEMQEAGYEGTELGDWGFMPTDAASLKAALQARRLALHSTFVPISFKDREKHAEGKERALRAARLLAAVGGSEPIIVLADENGKDPVRTQNAGRIHPDQGLSDTQWQIFAEGVEQTAEAVRRETGLFCVFHHHCAGYVETPEEIQRLLELTDPKLLGLCFDTGHYRFGGGDPLEGLRKYAERIRLFHFKDYHTEIGEQAAKEEWDYFTAVRNGVFCELGKGEIDFRAIVAELERIGYQGWGVVEQDVLPGMGSPKESALRNRAFLREIGL